MLTTHVVLRIWTRGHRMVSADGSTELWQPPKRVSECFRHVVLLYFNAFSFLKFSLSFVFLPEKSRDLNFEFGHIRFLFIYFPLFKVIKNGSKAKSNQGPVGYKVSPPPAEQSYTWAAWFRGYVRRLMFKRLRVWIPMPRARWIMFHILFVVKIVTIDVCKDWK